ncbi:outer membrane beta-barrel protein [Flavobacterium tructae]|uniref:outer membrane beta-barrel protein n=1 Tax=Flavobacterium tructae TaxID=1114873 RepID=UPI0035A913F2
MKKNILLFITILLYNLSTYAQAPRGVYISAGLSQNNLKSSDLLTDSKPGFTVGTQYHLGYHENYNFQFEFAYKRNILDVKYVEDNFEEAKNSKYKYSDISFGAYVNYYILKPEEDRFFLGPQAGAFVSYVNPITPSKGADVTNQYYLPYLLNESDLQDSSKFNYGLGLGLTGGYNDFRFDLRYSLGLANLLEDVQTHSFDSSNNYTGPTLQGKTNMISVTISYKVFSLSK